MTLGNILRIGFYFSSIFAVTGCELPTSLSTDLKSDKSIVAASSTSSVSATPSPNPNQTPVPIVACSFNGQSLANGSSTTAYQTNSVPFGSACVSENRRCANGALSGSYAQSTCSVAPAANCTFNNQPVTSGSSVTAYQAASVAAGSTCASQSRSCMNGNLSGSFTAASCSVGTAAACTFNGQTVPNGQSLTVYTSPTTSYGQLCSGIQKSISCSNGSLLPAGTFYPACTVAAGAACTFNNQTVAHGSSVTAYQSATAAAGSQCVSQSRVCTNGTLAGNYPYSACAAAIPTPAPTSVPPVITSFTIDPAQYKLSWTSTGAIQAALSSNENNFFSGANPVSSLSSLGANAFWYATNLTPGLTAKFTLTVTSLTGATASQTISVAAVNPCTFNNQSVAHGTSVTAYEASGVPFGSTCTSQMRACANGALSGSYQFASCTVGQASACSFNGQTVANATSVTAYEAATVPYGSICNAQSRSCANGNLSGTFTVPACSVAPAANCSLNNVALASGSSVTAYASANVPYGSTCSSQTRSCTNGTLSGTFTASSCSITPAASCSLSGQTIADASSITAYQASSVPYGSTCTSQTRNCSNGTLSGTYAATACTVAPAASCSFNSQTIANGGSVTAYALANVPYGGACLSQSRACANGSLSGNYTSATCSVGLPASCTFNGASVPNGSTVSAYNSALYAFGTDCNSVKQNLLCTNGFFPAGTYYPTCNVQPDPSCVFNNQKVASGDTVIAYQSASPAWPNNCVSQVRSCANQVLNGTYAYSSCTPGAAPAAIITSFIANKAGTADSLGYNLNWSSSGAMSVNLSSSTPIFAGGVSSLNSLSPNGGWTAFPPAGVVTVITLTATNYSGVSVSQMVTIDRTPLPAQKVAFTTQPTWVVAGGNLNFSVSGLDQNNTPVALPNSSTCNVSVIYNSASGLIGGTYAGIPVSGGTATFNQVSFQKAGTYTLKATCSGVANPSDESYQFPVTAGAGANLTVSPQPPATVVSNALIPVGVILTDAYGNPLADGVVDVTSPSGGTLGPITEIRVTNGVGMFTQLALASSSAGPFQLKFTSGAATVLSSSFVIAATATAATPTPTPPAYRLSFSAPLSTLYDYTTPNCSGNCEVLSVNPPGATAIPNGIQVLNATTGAIATEASNPSFSIFASLVKDNLSYDVGWATITNGVGTLSFSPPSNLPPSGSYSLQYTLLLNDPSGQQTRMTLSNTPMNLVKLSSTSASGVLNSPIGRVSGKISISASSIRVPVAPAVTVTYSLATFVEGSLVQTPFLLGTSNQADSSYGFTWDTTQQADGEYTLSFSVTDSFGTVYPTGGTSHITVDNSAQTITSPIGGTGGTPYTQVAPAGSYLHGFQIRYGEVLDNLQAIWINPDSSAQATLDPISHGGSGGSEQYTLNCANPSNSGDSGRMVVIGLTVDTCSTDNNQLQGINFQVTCKDFTTGITGGGLMTNQLHLAGKGTGCVGTAVTNHVIRCPLGQGAVGIQGSSDSVNESIQLICK